MKIVIAGALGHIGSQLIRELPMEFADAEIVMIDNMLTQRYCSLFDLPEGVNYRFIEADVLDVDLHSIIVGADVCFQLAAITDASSSFQNKDKLEHNNYNTTVKIIASQY